MQGVLQLPDHGIHLAGVGFHALNALLVFCCTRRVLDQFAPDASARNRVLAAGIGTLLWALHPLRVECIAWCSGLLYGQGGFFALVAWYARLRELAERSRAGGRGGKWFGLGAVAFAVSLLTYPVALF